MEKSIRGKDSVCFYVLNGKGNSREQSKKKSLTTTTSLTEKIWRVVRVRGGKIKRGKSAGRKGYKIAKGGRTIVKVPVGKLRRKRQRLRLAAKRLRSKRATIQRKTKRSKRIGSRIRRRKF